MKAASRLTLVFTVLIGLFVLGVAVAVGTLLTFDAPGLPVVAGVAVAAGLLAALITYMTARAVGLDVEEEEGERMPIGISMPETAGAPLRVKTLPVANLPVANLPVANLPAPYLAAVLKGLQANRTGPKAEWREF
jgi:hypothetical protein